MSRNGPIGYPGARPQARRPLTEDPYTTPPTGQPQQPHWPPRYAEPAAPSARVSGSSRPTLGRAGLSRRQGAGRRHGQGPSAAAALRARTHGQQPLPAISSRRPAPEQQGYPPPTAGTSCPSVAGHAGAGYAPPAQHAQTVPRGPDPQGYDLGNYMPATATCLCVPPRPTRSSSRTTAIPPSSARRTRATERPTPTSTRCWPRRRSSHAAAGAA